MEEYSEGAEGLKTLDLAEGSGTAVKQGDLVTVRCRLHYRFDKYIPCHTFADLGTNPEFNCSIWAQVEVGLIAARRCTSTASSKASMWRQAAQLAC